MASDLPRLPLALGALVSEAFRELGLGASIWAQGVWRALHGPPSPHLVADVPRISELESEHGVQPLRHLYNECCLARAVRTGRFVHARHSGLNDLFMPIPSDAAVPAVVVVGPFATELPNGAEVASRWRRLTQTQAHLTDPGFRRYLAASFAVPLFPDRDLQNLVRLVRSFAALLGGRGDPLLLAGDVDACKKRLLETALPDRMWAAAQTMVDERTTHVWLTALQKDPLLALGLGRAPRHAVASLAADWAPPIDPVDAAVRREAFQRAAVGMLRTRGGAVCGKIGEQGVLLLAEHAGPSTRAKLVDLATRLSAVARTHGLRLHAGIAVAEASDGLPQTYRSALAAAEKAFSRRTAIVFAVRGDPSSARLLRQLRRELAEEAEIRPEVLSARFQHYMEAVLAHAGHELHAVRAHLEAGLERLASPFLSAGLLDAKGFDELFDSEPIGEPEGATITGLVASYRRIVADMASAVASPTSARQDRGVRRALAFIHEHLTDRLTLRQVARVAGYAPDYVSSLIRRTEGVPYDRYLQRQRLGRAKQLLLNTTLSVDRIAQLSGFRSRTYFQRLFRDATGKTPAVFRSGKMLPRRPSPRTPPLNR